MAFISVNAAASGPFPKGDGSSCVAPLVGRSRRGEWTRMVWTVDWGGGGGGEIGGFLRESTQVVASRRAVLFEEDSL